MISTTTRTLVFLAALATAASAAAADGQAVAAYDTPLFNLVLDRANVIDGKKSFDKQFATSFDKLLGQSRTVTDKKSLAFLRKRLMSGPAGKPKSLTSRGRQYLYYEACQAHACDETNLGLLYDVETQSMSAILAVQGASEVLGSPSPDERKLLEAGRVRP